MIDQSVSDPFESVTYIGAATGMTPGSEQWDTTPLYMDNKPCVFKDGVVQYYLNPTNFTKKIDGTDADLTGADGDVMIEFPKMGWKINDYRHKTYVQVTREQNVRGFRYLAHTRDTEGDRDYLYVGVYLGSVDDNWTVLRSISGVAPGSQYMSLKSITNVTNNMQEGYDVVSFYPWTLLQCLYLLRYKNLNSQAALGIGRVGVGNAEITGTTDSYGMYYGSLDEQDYHAAVKCHGIEDLWGNLRQMIQGVHLNPDNQTLIVAHKDFNIEYEGYTPVTGSLEAVSASFYRIYGTSEAGFIPSCDYPSIATDGYPDNQSTFYSDEVNFNSWVYTVGGFGSSNYYAGIFNIYCNAFVDERDAYSTGRLMYL